MQRAHLLRYAVQCGVCVCVYVCDTHTHTHMHTHNTAYLSRFALRTRISF